MGAHTIGHFNKAISLFIYTWTGLSRNAFNNDYYGNLARIPKVAFPHEDCTPQTDAEGREGAARWATNVRKQTENGGPPFGSMRHTDAFLNAIMKTTKTTNAAKILN